MTTRSFIGCCLLMLIACNNPNRIPKNILTREKMQWVLWDVVRSQSFTDLFIGKDSSKNKPLENAKLQMQVFELHKITKAQFYESYQFYIDHPMLMQVMLDSLAAKAEREKFSKLYNQAEAR